MTRPRKPPPRAKVARARPRRGRARSMRPADLLPNAPSLPLDDFVAAAAKALALPIKPEWAAAIAANLATNLQMASLVAEFPLPDEMTPAPVFEA